MDNYTLFESYLSNKLSEKDRVNFEVNRKNDTALEEAFQEHLVTQTSMDLLLEEDVKSVIANLHIEQEAKQEGKKFKWSIIAFAVALALALVYFASSNKLSIPESEQLVAEYYKAPLDNKTRNGDDPAASRVAIAITKAHVALQAKDYSDAAIKFLQIQDAATGPEKERAEWYYVLCILDSDPAAAKLILKRIAQFPNHIKYQEAVKLLADPRF